MKVLLASLTVSVLSQTAPRCCWSKWGDASSCGNYPDGASGGICVNDGVTTCNQNSDCSGVTPTPPPPPPTPTPVPTPTPTPTPPAPTPTPPPAPTPPTPSQLPDKVMGLYLLIADDGDDGQGTKWHYGTETEWEPDIPDYMNDGANVLFLAFVNPSKMPTLPPAMVSIGQNKRSTQKVVASIGGQAYSASAGADMWPWLQSADAAEAMAVEVAKWQDQGIDGIDIDIEDGIGSSEATGPMVLAFITKLRSIAPDFIITQPVYGYPGVKEENYVVNQCFAPDAPVTVDSIGIMAYSGTGSISYVKNYATPPTYQGAPITSPVPTDKILLGACGCASAGDIQTLAQAVHDQDLGGIMVWYSSVNDKATGAPGNQYGGGNMDSSNKGTTADWAKALATMQGAQDIVA